MSKLCPKCDKELKNQQTVECELCWETMCWEHISLEDQGNDPRCFCEECQDFLWDMGIFDGE